jgi:hypothetical protein
LVQRLAINVSPMAAGWSSTDMVMVGIPHDQNDTSRD